MIFQDPYVEPEPADERRPGSSASRSRSTGSATKAERRERVRELLSTVGLNPDFGDRYPHEFSGGQRQRIGVARALALNPDLIVADEPISALDVSIQAQIINLLEKLQGQFGLTYLFIAHDLSVVRHISDRIAVMYLGRIVELASSRELNREPLHPYTVALLSAIPIPDPVVEARRRRIILRGDVPSPVGPAAGLPLPHPVLAPRAARQPGAVHDRGARAPRPRDRPRGGLPLRRGGRRVGRAAPGDRADPPPGSPGREPGASPPPDASDAAGPADDGPPPLPVPPTAGDVLSPLRRRRRRAAR